MYTLSDQQIDYILNDIRARGVEMESLQQSLLDHVCCIIEHNLEANGDFEGFYSTTIRTFYKEELREIEEETISLLTFKHYYTMRNIMIGSGAFAALTFLAGSFFKVMHWAGASALILLAITTVCVVFLPLMLVLKFREDHSTRDKWITAIGTVFGIMISMATLFKLQHWYGANILWLTSLAVLGFVFIPTYFLTGIRNPDTKVNTIVSSILLVIAAGLLFALSNVHSSRQTTEQTLHTYLENEALLTKLQTKGASDKELQIVDSQCKKMKAIILSESIGKQQLPDDFEEKGITFQERSLGAAFAENGEGAKLFQTVKEKIQQYNAQSKTPISLAHSILNEDIKKCTNLFALNSLTQLQLAVAMTEGQ